MGGSPCGRWLAVLASPLLLACGLGKSGLASGADAAADAQLVDGGGGGPDAGDDGGAGEAGCDPASCSGACCDGQCVDPSCSTCQAGGLFCPSGSGTGGTCLAHCSACSAAGGPTVACYTCADSGLTARCATSPVDCPGDLQTGACPCPSGNAEECPGPVQVCVPVDGDYVCLTNDAGAL